MAVIVPTVTATDQETYREQINRIKSFAKRIHIDLMDGEFAPTKSPELKSTWWPHELEADIHLMYQKPMDYLDELVKLKPRLVVVHSEADLDHMHFCAVLHKHGIDAGLALLQNTEVKDVERIIHSFDHVLIFSGHLGYHGGKADLKMIKKVYEIKQHHPDVEIGWDGGINGENAPFLIAGSVDVLNVGGYIHKSPHPKASYDTLEALANRDQK